MQGWSHTSGEEGGSDAGEDGALCGHDLLVGAFKFILINNFRGVAVEQNSLHAAGVGV